MVFDLSGKKIWVAGHNGMVGRAIVRALAKEGCEIVTADKIALDLRDQAQVHVWMETHRPDAIFLAAATVGGIAANAARPAEFIYDNMTIAGNVMHAAYLAGVQKLLFLGSSCIYPKLAKQPIVEDALLTGPLEPTNQWYAIAKIAGLKMCEAYRAQYGSDFISAMPTNLYGPYDRFDAEISHVIPALLHKLHVAKARGDATVSIWGSGKAKREFLHVDDLAAALILLMKNYSGARHVNIGSGEEISIKLLAEMIARVTGFSGKLVFDTGKPDGAPRKLLDSRAISAMGWSPKTALETGLSTTYRWYLANIAKNIA
jgi:GDP-L-fucose synthase